MEIQKGVPEQGTPFFMDNHSIIYTLKNTVDLPIQLRGYGIFHAVHFSDVRVKRADNDLN